LFNCKHDCGDDDCGDDDEDDENETKLVGSTSGESEDTKLSVEEEVEIDEEREEETEEECKKGRRSNSVFLFLEPLGRPGPRRTEGTLEEREDEEDETQDEGKAKGSTKGGKETVEKEIEG